MKTGFVTVGFVYCALKGERGPTQSCQMREHEEMRRIDAP